MRVRDATRTPARVGAAWRVASKAVQLVAVTFGSAPSTQSRPQPGAPQATSGGATSAFIPSRSVEPAEVPQTAVPTCRVRPYTLVGESF
jgi:hypothetical protein